MNILPCINKNTKEWKKLVSQTNGLLALDIYATKGGMPNIIEPSVIKEFIGFEEKVSDNSKLKSIANKLRLFNHNYNSSHSITVSNGKLNLNMNYLSIEAETERQSSRIERIDHDKYDFSKPVLGIFEKLDEQRNEFVSDIINTVKFKLGKSSAKELQPLQFLLPKGGKDNNNGNLDTVEQTYSWGTKVKNYFDKFYKASEFGSVIQLREDENIRGTILNINIPSKLIDYLQDNYGEQSKSGREDAREFYQEDSINDKLGKDKEELLEIKSELFIDKNIIPQIENFFASKIGNVEYYTANDIEAELGLPYTKLSAINYDNKTIINKDLVHFDSPISLYTGHLILSDLKLSNTDIYNKVLDILNNLKEFRNVFTSKFPKLNENSVYYTMFSTLLNTNEKGQLNSEYEIYWDNIASLVDLNVNNIFNKIFNNEFNLNMNSSTKDVLIQLKDNKEFISELNDKLDLNKDEIFKGISSKDIKNSLEELNYIQKICKI